MQALTELERSYIRMIADGLRLKQIAASRGRSIQTIRTQIEKIHKKAETSSLPELVAFGFRRGIIS